MGLGEQIALNLYMGTYVSETSVGVAPDFLIGINSGDRIASFPGSDAREPGNEASDLREHSCFSCWLN